MLAVPGEKQNQKVRNVTSRSVVSNYGPAELRSPEVALRECEEVDEFVDKARSDSANSPGGRGASLSTRLSDTLLSRRVGGLGSRASRASRRGAFRGAAVCLRMRIAVDNAKSLALWGVFTVCLLMACAHRNDRTALSTQQTMERLFDVSRHLSTRDWRYGAVQTTV